MSISDLPRELIQIIGDYLEPRDLSRFAGINRDIRCSLFAMDDYQKRVIEGCRENNLQKILDYVIDTIHDIPNSTRCMFVDKKWIEIFNNQLPILDDDTSYISFILMERWLMCYFYDNDLPVGEMKQNDFSQIIYNDPFLSGLFPQVTPLNPDTEMGLLLNSYKFILRCFGSIGFTERDREINRDLEILLNYYDIYRLAFYYQDGTPKNPPSYVGIKFCIPYVID